MIVADDLGTNDVGWVNQNNVNDVKTPQLDKLVSEGVHLANFYAQPICGPSRAALLTGRHPMNLGLQHANLQPEQENGVPTNETTLPERLKELGYVTHGIGKWHLGHWRRDLIPTSRGFDHWYGFLSGSQDHFNHTDGRGGNKGLDLWEDDVPDTTQRGVYSTHLFTSKAVEFIRGHAEVRDRPPFFLYLSYSAVHTPLQAPPEALARFQYVENEKRRIFAAMLAVMDEGIGNVTSTLAEIEGMLEATVVVFLSDNGGPTQEGANNWPLRGWKGSLFEGGVRSQAFIWSPLYLPQLRGKSWSGLMHITDVVPTIMGIVGGPAPQAVEGEVADGVDVWPALLESGPSPRVEIVHNVDPVGPCPAHAQLGHVMPSGLPCDSAWGGARYAAIRVDGWKLIRRIPGLATHREWQHGWVAPPGWQPPARARTNCSSQCIFTGKVKNQPQICLFDIERDPEERCNVAASNTAVVERLMERLNASARSAVPVRYPPRVPEKCEPRQFNNLAQWWAEADGTRAARLLPEPYDVGEPTTPRPPPPAPAKVKEAHANHWPPTRGHPPVRPKARADWVPLDQSQATAIDESALEAEATAMAEKALAALPESIRAAKIGKVKEGILKRLRAQAEGAGGSSANAAAAPQAGLLAPAAEEEEEAAPERDAEAGEAPDDQSAAQAAAAAEEEEAALQQDEEAGGASEEQNTADQAADA